MTINDLYLHILGITAPWRIRDVNLDIEKETVHVYVEHDPGAVRLCCSVCGCECPGYDTQEERSWRHLDTCQYMTYLVCSVPRVQCPLDGVRSAKTSWAEPSSHFTLMFEAFAITILLATKVQSKAAGLLRLSPDQIHRIMARGVARGLDRRSAQRVIEGVSLDEKSIAAGHDYITVLSDTDRGVVLDVAHTRTTEAARTLIERTLSPDQRKQVKCATMDMWEPFATAVKETMPGADIAHDRFHIAGYLNDAVDETRRAEHARLKKEGDSPLVKSRYLWLKNPENLSPEQTARFLSIMQNDLMTPKVWTMKDTFRDFFKCETETEAKTFFENWCEQATAIKNTFLNKVVKMLKKHIKGLLAVIKHRKTNAKAEALNGKIQVLKASARGYRNFASHRVAILFHFGGLQMNPQKTP